MYQDTIVILNDRILINDLVFKLTDNILDLLVTVNSKRHKKEVPGPNRLEIWTQNFDSVIWLLKHSQESKLVHEVHDKTRLYVTDHFVFSNYNQIITHHLDFVKLKHMLDLKADVSDIVVMSEWVKRFRKSRQIVFMKDTYANYVVEMAKKEYLPIESQRVLKHYIKEHNLIPPSATVHDLVMCNKAGLLYANENMIEKLYYNVYAPDASSYFASQLFRDDYPIGKFERYKWNRKLLSECVTKGYWFVCHGRSKDFIELPYETFRPYRLNKDKGYRRDKAGYYHYIVLPKDYKLVTEHFNYDPFTDDRIEWSGVSVCKEVGKLPKEWLDFVIILYQNKSNAKTPEERQMCKDALNCMFGKGYPGFLKDSREHRGFYYNRLWNPQWAAHMVSSSRYETMCLVKELGECNVMALANDCIKTTNPWIVPIIRKHNNETKERIKSFGYDCKIGQWDEAFYDTFILFGIGKYCGDTKEGFHPVLSGVASKAVPHSMEAILSSNTIEDGKITRTKGKIVSNFFTLWKDTNKRLKAKEEYEKWLLNGRTCLRE